MLANAMERQVVMNPNHETQQTRLTDECVQRMRPSFLWPPVCCVFVMAFLIGGSATAQQDESRSPTEVNWNQQSSISTTESKREELVRELEALRSAKLRSANTSDTTSSFQSETKTIPVVESAAASFNAEQPEELFLDLSTKGKAKDASLSPQGSAATLAVSMTSSPTQVLMRAVAWIAIILCVCCLVVLGARHWQRQRGLLPTTTARSRVLETLSLGPSRTVSLIEMHGYRALVASDATGIRSLVLAPTPFEETIQHEIIDDVEN